MLKACISLLFCLFLSLSSANAVGMTTLDENQCFSYGKTAANISIMVEAGASKAYILSLLDNSEFKTNPEDIQRLILVTVDFLTSVGQGSSPQENFKGATNFCLGAKGDVEKMIITLQKTLGTEI